MAAAELVECLVTHLPGSLPVVFPSRKLKKLVGSCWWEEILTGDEMIEEEVRY